MVQLVRDDHIILAEKRFKDAGVGVEAARVQNRVFTAVELSNLPLELLMDVLQHKANVLQT